MLLVAVVTLTLTTCVMMDTPSPVPVLTPTPTQTINKPVFIPTPTPTLEPVLLPGSGPMPTPEPEPEPEPEAETDYTLEAEYIAKTVWGEARGCPVEEQEQVIWCVLNRVDNDNPYFPDDIISVITQPYQFHGYSEYNPVEPEHYDLALDVLERWEAEKRGEESNRNLPPEYLYFGGDGQHNYFRTEY